MSLCQQVLVFLPRSLFPMNPVDRQPARIERDDQCECMLSLVRAGMLTRNYLPVDFRIPRNLTDGNVPTPYNKLPIMTTTSSSNMSDAIQASMGVPKACSELGWPFSEPNARHGGPSHCRVTTGDIDGAVRAAKVACGSARKKKRMSIEIIDMVGSNLLSRTQTHQTCFPRRPRGPNSNLLLVRLPRPPLLCGPQQSQIFPTHH